MNVFNELCDEYQPDARCFNAENTPISSNDHDEPESYSASDSDASNASNSEPDESSKFEKLEANPETVGNTSVETGSINLENTSVDITDSKVHFGHSISQSTQIKIENPTSVRVDKRRINYITCTEQKLQRKVVLVPYISAE